MLWRNDLFWKPKAFPRNNENNRRKICVGEGTVAMPFHLKLQSLTMDRGALVGSRVQTNRGLQLIMALG